MGWESGFPHRKGLYGAGRAGKGSEGVLSEMHDL